MRIESDVGAGGRGMQKFLSEFILNAFSSKKIGDIGLDDLDDSADFGEYVFSIDGHTVQPLFFKGGDIGKLAACGTLNDVSVMGAKPIALANSMIIEEGFDSKSLEKIIFSMNKVLEEVGASLLCGDTKVVEERIGIFVTTAGIGVKNKALENNLEILRNKRSYASNFVKDSGLGNGDKIIVTGTIGDHGISLMSLRENLSFETELESDVAPIWSVVERAMKVGGITSMKDPTRGGVSAALNEISKKSQVGIEIDEKKVPIRREVQAASEMLGLNFYDVACEGKILIGVLEEYAEDVLEEIKKTKYGRNAETIGKASKNHKKVILKTKIGGKRILEAPLGDPVPRVC